MSELKTPEQLLWQYISTGKVSKSDAHAALVQIAKEDDPGSIYLLAGLCCDQDSAIREQSWYALARLLRHVEPQTLATIDGRMRLFHVVFHVDRVNLATVPTHVLGLISFSFNGHVREAAVRELARRFEGDELAFLLLRLNDWVDIVRDAAFTAVLDRLQRDYASHFAANSALLMRLWQTQRYDHRLVRQRIESTLMSPAGIELLRKGLDSENLAVVRYISGLLLGEDNPERDSDILLAIAHRNSCVRLLATEIALTTFSDSRVKALISQWLPDPFAPIRKEALRWIAERKEENWQPPLIENLFSSSGGIRELARFYLRDQDVTHIYMQALDAEDQPTSRLEATLKGLLETAAHIEPVLRIKARYP